MPTSGNQFQTSETKAGRALVLTHGDRHTKKTWPDRHIHSWPDLARLLTSHTPGTKAGTCVVPATFRGEARRQEDADRIDVLMLDSDSGATLAEIEAGVRARGWAAAISSTHSHLANHSVAKRGAWEKWLAREGFTPDGSAASERFLVEDRGMLPRVAAGAIVAEQDEVYVTFRHAPCPRYRVVLPLARPWHASDYPCQTDALADWQTRYAAAAVALNLFHDASCADASRVFFLPRHPPDGPSPECVILDGHWLDLHALPVVPAEQTARRAKGLQGAGAGRPSGGFDSGRDPPITFEDPDTGEVIDLRRWICDAGNTFRIVAALRRRAPHVVWSRVVDGKHHIRCPNADAHTDPSDDLATFVADPGNSAGKGFVIHCRHAHCTGRDRLLFLRQMLQQRWLTPDDLKDPALRLERLDERPLIRITAGSLPDVVRQAEDALAAASEPVYQRGSLLVRPGVLHVGVGDGAVHNSLQVVELEDHALAAAMGDAARWEHYDARRKAWAPCDPPLRIATTLRQMRGRWQLPVLVGVASAPTLRPDGSVLGTPGYDPETGLFLDTRGVIFPAVPGTPARSDALRALALIDDLLATFPFVDEPSRSVALSCALSATVRPTLPTTPAHAFTAPVAGSGKSLLVDLASVIATGRPASVIAQGAKEEELEKRLGALLLHGTPIVAIDNCEAPLGGEFLCSMLTQQVVRCRILGRSEVPELPSASLVTATGNNLALLGDMTRRTILCRLDPGVERPELRRFSRDVLREAATRRPELLVGCLTVLRAYVVAGLPERPAPLGSFVAWSDLVRGALVWLGRADPVLTMEQVRDTDPRLEAATTVVAEWAMHVGPRAVTVRELIETATEQRTDAACPLVGSKLHYLRPEFREALLVVAGDGGSINGKRLGQWVASLQGRVVAGRRITSAPMQSGNKRWKLEEAVDAVAA